MRALDSIKRMPMEIAVALAGNTRLQQLLVDDKNELANNFTPYSINDLLKHEYISFTPVFDNNIKNNKKNTFLIINIEMIEFDDMEGNTRISGDIFIGTDRQNAILKNNTSRLLEIVDEIYKTLQDKKLSAAGAINVDYANFISYSEYVFGYKISFKVMEQETRKAEI